MEEGWREATKHDATCGIPGKLSTFKRRGKTINVIIALILRTKKKKRTPM